MRYTLGSDPIGQEIGDAILAETSKALLIYLSLALVGIYVIYKAVTK